MILGNTYDLTFALKFIMFVSLQTFNYCSFCFDFFILSFSSPSNLGAGPTGAATSAATVGTVALAANTLLARRSCNLGLGA